MTSIAVIGHKGRLGKPLIEILNRHPYSEIKYFESRSEIKGKLPDADLFFLALPPGESNNYLDKHPELNDKILIDLSIDHRLDLDIDYKLDKGWVYGLPEFNRENIKYWNRIACPGCYATAILEALSPIKGIVSNINIKAYSGVSGKPNQPVDENKGIERYSKSREHPQVAEIERFLGRQIESLETHLVYPLKTGIVAKIDADLQDSFKVLSLSKHFSLDNSFLKIIGYQPMPDEESDIIKYLEDALIGLENSNYCNISFDMSKNHITLISSLDNLIKGGAGQAVQNMNLMLGCNETEGLI